MGRLIGFAGLAGSGKDTCADVLVAERGFTKLAFATALKTLCRDIFELSDAQLWGAEKETVDPRYGRTPRALMQMFGTDFIREQVSSDFWVRRLLRTAEDVTGPVVVCDVRFQDEVDAIVRRGGEVWWVQREPVAGSGHCSERPDLLRGLRGSVENDGSLRDLRQTILAV